MHSLLRRSLLFLTGSTAAQGLSAATGLLLARWLSVEEYAIYSIVFVLMGAISLLTKGGIHLGFSAILGRTWPDMDRASQAVNAALLCRKKLSRLALPPLLLVSAWLLYRNGAGTWQTLELTALLLVFWWADMKTRVVDQILNFAKQTSRIQILDAALAFFRLLAASTLFIFGGLNLIIAVTISIAASLIRTIPVLKWIEALLPNRSNIAIPQDIEEIKTGVRRQLPSDIFQAFQIQIIIILITISASTTEVASYGALLRIMQLMVPFQTFYIAFLIPYFSKAKERVFIKLLSLISLSSLPGIALVFIAAIRPEHLLWLVGENYSGLSHEIFVAAVVTAFSSITTTAWWLVAHRGWLKWSWVQIPLGLLWCIVAPIYWLDMSSLSDALILQSGFSAALLVPTAMGICSALRTKNLENQQCSQQ